MKKLLFIYLFLTISLGLLATNCYAETTGSRSVEWLTVLSQIVAVGKVLSVEKMKWQGSVVYENYVLAVSKNVKGAEHQKLIKFTIRAFSPSPVFGKTINLSDEVIVFLSPYHENEDFLKGKLVPTSDSYPLSIFNLSNPPNYKTDLNFAFIDMNFKILTSRDEIIKTCQQTQKQLQIYLKSHKLADVKGFYIDRPKGAKTFAVIGYTDFSFLQVPNFISPESKPTIIELFKSRGYKYSQ